MANLRRGNSSTFVREVRWRLGNGVADCHGNSLPLPNMEVRVCHKGSKRRRSQHTAVPHPPSKSGQELYTTKSESAAQSRDKTRRAKYKSGGELGRL